MRMRTVLVAMAAIGLVGGAMAHAADQTILGSGFTAKNPSTPEKRRVTVKAKEKSSPNTLVGDPVTTGASLTVRANGGSPTSQTFTLPATNSPTTGKPFWSGSIAKGFKYRDGKYENGPVGQVSIKKTAGGVFLIVAKISGKVAPLNVLPPNPGTSACALLDLLGGTTYSVQFAPADGLITNKDGVLYKQKKISVEGTCVVTTTTVTTTTTTTTTTIPVCSPNCGINTPCLTNGNCASGFCSGGLCKCPNKLFTFDISSNDGGSFDSAEWPGGTASQNGPTGCSVTINRPSNNIDIVGNLGDHFSVNSKAGYSSCTGTGGEDGDGCAPLSCPPAGIGSCEAGRPSCSAALNGSGSARYTVQCLQ